MEAKNLSELVKSSEQILDTNLASSCSYRHSLRSPKACSFCGKVFPHHSAVRRHEVIHTSEKPYRCKICPKAYKDPSSLRKHKLVHSGEMPFRCADCNMSFRWAFSLMVHRRELSSLQCKACGGSFVSQCALKQHPCSSGDSLANKPFTHTSYPCSYCGKHFNTASIVKRHERVHTGEKPYMCTTCGGQFGDASTLRNHQAVHTCDMPYKCEDCGKCFRWPNRFKAHKLIHAGINPFLCTKCGVRMRTKKQLVKHCSKEHGYQITESVLPTGFPDITEGCESKNTVGVDVIASSQVGSKQESSAELSVCRFCGKRFSTCYNARAHERIHTGEKPYSCTHCSKKFSDRSSLRNHLFRHSGEKPYKCNICLQEFRQVSNLRVHQLKHFGFSANEDECDDNPQVTIKTEPLDLLITDEPTEILDVNMGLDGESFLNLICEKEDFIHNSEMMNIQEVIEALPAVDNDYDVQPDVQECLQLRSDNLPFELSANDKLFSETFVVIERIDIPRIKCVITKTVYIPLSSKYSVDQSSHVCSVCAMWFRNDVTLRRHIPLHSGVKPYNCSDCHQAFRWSISLKYHQQILDEGSKLLCKSCGQQFESQCSLRQHSCRIATAALKQETECEGGQFMIEYASDSTEQLYLRNQTAVNPLQCRECGKLFRFVASRKKHEKLHSGEKPHMCTTCGKQFADYSTLRNHRRVHTGVKPLKCDECGKTFLWPSRLESHKMLHAGINPHKCKICGERFRFRKGLLDHKETCISQSADHSNTEVQNGQCDEMVILQSVVHEIHPNHMSVGTDIETYNKKGTNHTASFSKLLKCCYCDKQFLYDFELRKHEQMHVSDKPYRCDDCGKFYANSTCLRLHQRLHTGDKPHTCQQCGMQFRWLGALTSHLDVHSEVFPHACRSCGERFKTQQDLKQHRLQAHSADPNNGERSRANNSYRCPICEKPFCNRHYLKKHILLHTSEMPYKCDDCGKTFRWQASLKNHKVQEHDGVNPVVCKDCGQGFKSVYSLKKHCLIDHGSTKIFMCRFCPKYFLSSYAQARHEVVHQKKLLKNVRVNSA